VHRLTACIFRFISPTVPRTRPLATIAHLCSEGER
jgi:hypothetical protein